MHQKTKNRSWTYLFLLIICAKFNHIWALEEPRQEIYLQPRNYNPHPYQVDVQASNHITPNRGPILFPPSPAPDVDNERSNFIRVENDRNVAPHPVDNHPYPKVARKYRFRNPGRHQEYVSSFIKLRYSRKIA
ncbi:hypothetical protein HHI36_018735 [Cryptolaemus montrouzieri]|uniref:Uncharacterized protein n=1 Tax=Cryptolaemus montrouzieri TaxID=559131 RepID=A0ABD2P0U1_9CUCU